MIGLPIKSTGGTEGQRSRCWLLLLVLLLFNLVCGYSQGDTNYHIRKRTFGLEDKLGRHQIDRVELDSLGFYWLACTAGLYRYNGKDFEFFDKKALGFKGNGKLRMYTDALGTQWLLEESYSDNDSIRIGKLDIIQGRVRFPILEVENVDSTFQVPSFRGVKDGGGRLYGWDFQNRLYEIRGGELRLIGCLPTTDRCYSLGYVADFDIVIVAADGKLFEFSNGSQQAKAMDLPLEIQTVVVGTKGVMIQAKQLGKNSLEVKLYFYDYALGNFRELSEINRSESPAVIGLDDKGGWVIRTEREIYFYDYHNEKGVALNQHFRNRELFSQDKMPLFAFFLRGQYWFSFHQFVEVVELVPKQFTVHFKEESPVSIRGIVSFGDSSLYLNTYVGERKLSSDFREMTTSYGFSIPIKVGYGLAVRGEDIFSGVHGKELIRYDVNTKVGRVVEYDGKYQLEYSAVLLPFIDKANTVWLGLEEGLGRYDEENDQLVLVQTTGTAPLAKAKFNAVTPVPESNYFWLATNRGAFLFDPIRGKVISNIAKFAGEDVTIVRQYGPDSVWVLPYAGDAFLWNTKLNTWDSLDVFHPEWQNNLHDILLDERGFYWLSSNNGLIRYDPEKDRFTRLTQDKDGLPFNEFNKLATLITPQGDFLFGGIDGLVRVDPASFAERKQARKYEYPLKLRSLLSIVNREEEVHDLSNYDYRQAYTLSPETQQIRINFACLNPISDRYEYFYRNEGAVDWLALDQPSLILNELGYQRTSLELMVQNADTKNILGSAFFSFVRKRPWYLHFFAFLGYFSLLPLIVFAFVKWRTLLIIKEKESLEALIYERTNELERDRMLIVEQRNKLAKISSMQQKLFSLLGHELRSPLLSVIGLKKKAAYLIEKKRYADFLTISAQLSKQAENVDRLITQLLEWGRLIMHDRPPQVVNFSLAELADEIAKEYEEVTAEKGVSIKNEILRETDVHYDEGAMKIILRNFLHNAIKFSNAGGMITCYYEVEEERLNMVVLNEGIGVEEEDLEAWRAGDYLSPQIGSGGEKGSGLGLIICREIAWRNDSEIVIENLERGPGVLAKLSWKRQQKALFK